MNRRRRMWPVREYQSDLTGVVWQEYVSADGSARVAVWVQGYLSAWNVVGIMQSGRFADLTSISTNEQWAYVVGFCQRNPDGFVLDAAREILATRLKMETGAPLNR